MKINREQYTNKRIAGFTLIEMLLVMVIVSLIIVMGTNYLQQRTLQMRVDRATNQMQQILNASLAYYVSNGKWPADLTALQTNSAYLPANNPNTGELSTPWGGTYVVVSNTSTTSSSLSGALVYVYFPVTYTTASPTAPAVAHMIAGGLPLSYVTSAAPTTGTSAAPPPDDGSCAIGDSQAICYVVAAVSIPGQNLNNAMAVNYAGLYHSGACVPAPTCPVDQNGIQMTPNIMVVPVSVSGVNDAPTGSGCNANNLQNCNVNVYPVSSFTAVAVGDTNKNPVALTGGKGPVSCTVGSTTADTCLLDASGTTLSNSSTKYWRVCLSVVTEKGTVTPSGTNSNPWGQLQGTIMAITRCVPSGEATGSGFNVWAPQ